MQTSCRALRGATKRWITEVMKGKVDRVADLIVACDWPPPPPPSRRGYAAASRQVRGMFVNRSDGEISWHAMGADDRHRCILRLSPVRDGVEVALFANADEHRVTIKKRCGLPPDFKMRIEAELTAFKLGL
jgi:hypothetical protein